jgi:hypothetical protein
MLDHGAPFGNRFLLLWEKDVSGSQDVTVSVLPNPSRYEREAPVILPGVTFMVKQLGR